MKVLTINHNMFTSIIIWWVSFTHISSMEIQTNKVVQSIQNETLHKCVQSIDYEINLMQQYVAPRISSSKSMLTLHLKNVMEW